MCKYIFSFKFYMIVVDLLISRNCRLLVKFITGRQENNRTYEKKKKNTFTTLRLSMLYITKLWLIVKFYF